jgi:uncharacterized protein (DUF58 family)
MTALALLGVGLLAALMAWREIVWRLVVPTILASLDLSPSSVPHQGEVEVAVTVTNPSWFPCPLVRCEIALPDGLEPEAGSPVRQALVSPLVGQPPGLSSQAKHVVFTVSLAPHEAVTVRFHVKGVRRGAHRIQGIRVEFGDGFTGRREQRMFVIARTAVVHPRLHDGTGARLLARRLGPTTMWRKVTSTASDWVDLRPYAVGDSVRDIAWMPSARSGSLIVLERASAMRYHVVIVTSVRASHLRWEARTDLADRIYEAAFSLMQEVSRRGAEVSLYCDAYWTMSRMRSSGHRVLTGAGGWTPRFQHHVGHSLGVLSVYQTVPLSQVLTEVGHAMPDAALVVVILAYEDDATRQAVLRLSERGHIVELHRVGHDRVSQGTGGPT